jgi:head-tail adaptor
MAKAPPTAGDFRHRVQFFRPLNSNETTQDAYGQDLPGAGPVLVGTFWCKIEPLQGTEDYKSDQVFGKNMYLIQLRHQPGTTFTTKMRAVWTSNAGTRTMNILNINDVVMDYRPIVSITAEDFSG